MAVHDVAARGFGDAAEAYEQARPSYSADAVAWLVEQLGITPGATVCDLAAGTGKLTRQLVPRYARVLAVEPLEGMRAVLERVVPGAEALEGTASAIPLEADAVDGVFVGEAFHWFSTAETLAEIARVLRPGGTLAILFNQADGDFEPPLPEAFWDAYRAAAIEKPPEQTELDDTKIATVNQAGLKDDGIIAPPVSDAGKGVVEAPKKEEDDADKIFTKVEIESSYPGGDGAWARFLNKNLHYPDEALNNNIEGTVMVQFVVDQEGNVSDVQAVGGPTDGGLREEAIRVIKKSGKWTAAVQNGHKVKSYKRQPVGFKTGE